MRFATATYFLLPALLASVAGTLASPTPITNGTAVLDKRAYTGRGTWFEVGLGNCGEYNVDSDPIVALATSTYADGKHCNKKIKITSNGKTATATVRDSCPSCASGDLDMSPSLFKNFASLGTGVVRVSWSFI